MIFYKLNYRIGKFFRNDVTPEQKMVSKYLSAELPAREAKYLWERIVDHKWYVSEGLKRDVGFRVAAVDYVENFYEPVFFNTRRTGFRNALRELFKIISRTEFLRPKSL
ncbi:MAG TPA: DUF4032 domain-containing protein [Pyrinomonadaceae bacterium]|jgi:hypothetical protein